PAGLTAELMVSQLLPAVEIDSSLSDADIALYESAWNAFAAGDWQDALDKLNALPDNDHVKDYLANYVAQNNDTPPADWNGVISMQAK
ncbi:MAG TPA: hypothetical protein VK137_19845, partial [Planctomycetaceae bacterium]|nr:hypothetical protein [Planctomycetaceae bacterium]